MDSLERDAATLFREFSWLQELDHPALIRLRAFDFAGTEQRRPYLVMEHFEGETLAEYVARHGIFSPDDWFEIAWPIARALQAAHGRNVLHRSLRPGCVLLRREQAADGPAHWRVKLLDFGLSLKRTAIHAAASHPAARVQTTLGRSVARTLAYLAAEVLNKPKGQVWVGPHSDVYSFGQLGNLALTGRPNPDAGDRVILSDDWRKLLDDCCNWVQPKRLEHFGFVLDRLSHRPGANERIAGLERELYESTIHDHSATLDADPDNVAAYINRGNAFARQGDYTKAIADFSEAAQEAEARRLLPISPHGGSRSPPATAYPQNAADDYSEALRVEPRNLEAHANRAAAYSQLQEYDKSIADYTEAIHLNPRDPTLLFNRGNARP